MSNIPENLKYTKKHEWVSFNKDENTATFGITNYAQDKLGDIVYIELPEQNKQIKQAEEISVIESVKAASDIYAPISGIIKETNDKIETNPELINSSPHEDGWIAKIIPNNINELDNLLSAEEYKNFIEKQE